MRWLPEHGVGIIAIGNLTYTSWGSAADAGARRAGEDRRAAAARAAAVGGAGRGPGRRDAPRRTVGRRAGGRDRGRSTSSWTSRRTGAGRAVEALAAQVGACRPDGAFEVENALRGEWTMTCDRGDLRVAITLAPTMPPTVQYLAVRSSETTEAPTPGPTACLP